MNHALPQFPQFARINPGLAAEINQLTAAFPVYSDFNFISLYSWDTDETMMASQLNGNLVILFKDYTTNKAFLSCIGDEQVDETLEILLKYSQDSGYEPHLQLVPEHTIASLEHPEKFSIVEDPDSHDYIISVDALTKMEGKRYSTKRYGVNRFRTDHKDNHTIVDLPADANTLRAFTELFEAWRLETGHSHEETDSELRAIIRVLSADPAFSLQIRGIYIGESLVGFSIFELTGDYAVAHFEKAFKSYPGLYDYLKYTTAEALRQKGVKYMNYEQDLGIEGLRRAKQLLHPAFQLKKYTVKRAEPKS